MRFDLLLLVLLALTTAVLPANASSVADRPALQPLWPNGAPGAKGAEPRDIPSIALYPAPADKATGAAIVVCPGGGYGALADDHEGRQIAEWLNARGVTAAVLRYRIAPHYMHPTPMLDVLRAIRTVRARCAEWKGDPKRIGVWGFSAGGHLASMAATHFDDGDPNAPDPIDRVSSRPDVAILCYPVISMSAPYTHMGCRRNLLGPDPAPELVDLMSNEKQVTKRTPPVFLFHTADDSAVPLANSLLFALACRKEGVPVELHVYEHGAHGVGLAQSDPVLSAWPNSLNVWLRGRAFTP